MVDPNPKPKPEPESEPKSNDIPPDVEEQLDADEEEFRAMRRDLDGVKGASAAGIVSISVGKDPGEK